MYINYINDRKELGFQATHDSKAADQVDLIVKITGFWIVITFSRINAQGSDEQFLVRQSYSAIPAQKIIKKFYLLDQND